MTGPFAGISWRAWRVWQRNLDVFLATWHTNFLPPMLEPVMYVLSFGFGLGSLVGSVTYMGREIPYLDFMAPGVVAVAIMFWSYFETTYSSFVRMYYQRTFDAIVATPLLVEDVIAGEWLWGGTKALLASGIMTAVLALMGLVSFPSGLVVLPVAVLGGLLFSAVGLVATSLSPKIDSFNLPAFLFIFPMFLFAGTFFPLDVLPGWAHAVALALPLTHVGLLVRGAFLGVWAPSSAWSVVYLLLATPACSAVAIALMRRRLVK